MTPAIRGFDWDRGNRDKCQKHGMSIEEIEGVFSRAVVILPDKENPHGEPRLKAIGKTPGGRRGGSAMLRPISARFMHRKEVESYEEAYPDVEDR